MKHSLSLVECFDATAAKSYLKRSRIEFSAWLASFAVLTALFVALYCVYGLSPTINRNVALAFAIVFSVVAVCGLTGSIWSFLRYQRAKRTILDGGEYIKQVAQLRTESVLRQLQAEAPQDAFVAHGFYFNDVDTPYVYRQINADNYSSNYQASVVYVKDNALHFCSVVFSLLKDEQRTLNGDVPLERITSIGMLKPNGIDLFCPQLKVCFGPRCMLFALNAAEDYHAKVDALRQSANK